MTTTTFKTIQTFNGREFVAASAPRKAAAPTDADTARSIQDAIASVSPEELPTFLGPVLFKSLSGLIVDERRTAAPEFWASPGQQSSPETWRDKTPETWREKKEKEAKPFPERLAPHHATRGLQGAELTEFNKLMGVRATAAVSSTPAPGIGIVLPMLTPTEHRARARRA